MSRDLLLLALGMILGLTLAMILLRRILLKDTPQEPQREPGHKVTIPETTVLFKEVPESEAEVIIQQRLQALTLEESTLQDQKRALEIEVEQLQDSRDTLRENLLDLKREIEVDRVDNLETFRVALDNLKTSVAEIADDTYNAFETSFQAATINGDAIVEDIQSTLDEAT